MKVYRALALVTILGVVASAPALAGQAAGPDRQAQTRFRGMDTDRDGVITRAEWRGNDQAFRQQDTNRDGVLSGNEVRGVVAEAPPATDEETRRREATIRFDAMDTDRDGVITRAEWRGNAQMFQQQDTNRDGVLSGSEVHALASQDHDTDGDGVITRAEWRGDAQAFREQDTNRDGVLSGSEVRALQHLPATAEEMRRRQALSARFNRADQNRDGRIARAEWTGNPTAFTRMDNNTDGIVSRREFMAAADAANADRTAATSGERPTTPAYQAGHVKGLAEGRQAGKQDRNVNGSRWDLEGQRELEQADSGYNPRVGPRDEYQAGYRVGFRLGYKEGFGPR